MVSMQRALFAAGLALAMAASAEAAVGERPIQRSWPHSGIFGSFDRAAVQRGLIVYENVCSACHSLNYVHFRDLTEIELSAEEARAIAETYLVEDGPDDFGDMFERPGALHDRFPPPYPNEQAARAANNGALPPDLSLMTKARADGVNYLYSFLIGYEEAPDHVEVPPGMYYNRYFPGNLVAMPDMLFEGAVDYPDGTPATEAQMAADVAQFLHWAADPKLEERKQMGLKVMLFLIAFTGIFYAYKRKLWAEIEK